MVGCLCLVVLRGIRLFSFGCLVTFCCLFVWLFGLVGLVGLVVCLVVVWLLVWLFACVAGIRDKAASGKCGQTMVANENLPANKEEKG